LLVATARQIDHLAKTEGAGHGLPAPDSFKPLLTPKKLGIDLGVLLPLLRKIVLREDGRNRAYRHTGSAVYALNRINIEHLVSGEGGFFLLGMNAIYWASVHAGRVLGTDARFSNYVGHRPSVSLG
jgi:hypothetical protein